MNLNVFDESMIVQNILEKAVKGIYLVLVVALYTLKAMYLCMYFTDAQQLDLYSIFKHGKS